MPHQAALLEKFAPFLPVILTTLLYLALVTPGVDPITTDWAMYVMHARNIATGLSYAEHVLCLPAGNRDVRAQHLPFGISSFAGASLCVFGMNILAFKIATNLALSLSLWPIYLLNRRYLGLAQSLLLTTALGFSAAYLISSG